MRFLRGKCNDFEIFQVSNPIRAQGTFPAHPLAEWGWGSFRYWSLPPFPGWTLLYSCLLYSLTLGYLLPPLSSPREVQSLRTTEPQNRRVTGNNLMSVPSIWDLKGVLLPRASGGALQLKPSDLVTSAVLAASASSSAPSSWPARLSVCVSYRPAPG